MLIQPRSWIRVATNPRTRAHRVRLSAAHDEWNHVGIALLAMEEGFFAQEGLEDVELITFPEDSGTLLDREAVQVDLLARGHVDIGIDPRTTFVLEANAAGQPVCIVAARRKNHAFILIGQRGLKTVEDLRGTAVDMGVQGGATDVMMRQLLKDSGLEPDHDVTFTYASRSMHDSATGIASFREGSGGAAILVNQTHVGELLQEGYPMLLDLRTRYPSRHDRVTAANAAFAVNQPELLRGFLKGMIRACNFVVDLRNASRFKQVIIDSGFLTTEREERNFDGLFMGWQERASRDLGLPRDGIELIVDEQKRAGRIAPSFDVDAVLRLDALRQAQRDLGLAE